MKGNSFVAFFLFFFVKTRIIPLWFSHYLLKKRKFIDVTENLLEVLNIKVQFYQITDVLHLLCFALIVCFRNVIFPNVLFFSNTRNSLTEVQNFQQFSSEKTEISVNNKRKIQIRGCYLLPQTTCTFTVFWRFLFILFSDSVHQNKRFIFLLENILLNKLIK